MRPPVSLLLLAALACAPAPGLTAGAPDRTGTPATPFACSEPAGRTEELRVPSAALGRDERVQVHLPPCYDSQTAARYGAVYALHGAGDDGSQWDVLGLDEAADRLALAGEILPQVVVIVDGGPFYEPGGDPPPIAAYLAEELVPAIDGAYRTVPDAAHRSLHGISLGGAVALVTVGAHPDVFGALGGHSGAYGGAAAPARALADNGVRVYLDVGDDDGLRGTTERLAGDLEDAGVEHELHIGDGGHVGSYWAAHVEDYLRFAAAAPAD